MRRVHEVGFIALLFCVGCSSSHSDPPAGPREPGPRPTFPLKTPSLTGYRLVEAFSAAQVSSLSGPIALVWRKQKGAPPFALNYPGFVSIVTGDGANKVLDFSASVSTERESGALGLALHPKFDDASDPHPYAFVWYDTNGSPQTQRLSRFTWSQASQTFDPASETILVEQAEQSPNHNGGKVAFGPDGFLYFGNGDDENKANHQTLENGLFAGIFRIDVDARGGDVSHAPPRQPNDGTTSTYFIPNSNPFVGKAGALEEFYALGLRNPFQFSFDKSTGELWVGDVGETFREEINRVTSGGNYEWPDKEGELSYTPMPLVAGTRTGPVHTYSHWEIADVTAILGGYVYRGSKLPELAGKYIFSDWISGRVWALDLSTTPPTRSTLIDTNPRYQFIGISEDEDGELYFSAWNQIVALDRDPDTAKVPKHLSETMLFPDMEKLSPHPALVPYEIDAPLWSDAAAKQRWISVPEGQTIAMVDGALKPPAGTYAVKHFELPQTVSPRDRGRRLETRVMVVGEDETYGLSYRWNAAGTDADLVTEPIYEGFEDDAAMASRLWHFPSAGQCWSCHRKENRLLGFVAPELHKTLANGVDQIAALGARGVFDASVTSDGGWVSPSDTAASLDKRVESYLAANCSSCHHPRDEFVGYWDARFGVALGDRALISAPNHNSPMATRLGLPSNALLIVPGEPAKSLLLARLRSNEPDLRMPPLGRNLVDAEAAALIEQWIASMSP
jgi:glucose/arabinose dehydrogenase